MKNLVVGSIVLMLVTFGWGERERGGTGPQRRGGNCGSWIRPPELGVDYAGTSSSTSWSSTRMASWCRAWRPRWRWLDDRTLEMTLRQGVTFHNGEVFDAEIVKLNWEENTRLQQPHMSGDYYELQTGVAPGDPRSAHGPVRVSGTGRRGHGQAGPHAYRQSPVLSRIRLGGEELVNYPRRWPVGHGPIQAGGRLLPPGQTDGPRRPGSQSGVLGSPPGCHGCNGSSLTTRWPDTRRWSW